MPPSSPAAIWSRAARSAGTYRRQYATCSGTPAAAAVCAADDASEELSPHGFSHRIGRPCAATSPMSRTCWSLGAAMRTPSSSERSSISDTLACSGSPAPARPAPARPARVCSEGSATAAIATSSEPAIARRWVRPMRPAPASPSRNAATSQPPGGQVRAVVALVLRGPGEPLGGAREDVLLDDQPALEADAVQAVEDGLNVKVAVAERAERLP